MKSARSAPGLDMEISALSFLSQTMRSNYLRDKQML